MTMSVIGRLKAAAVRTVELTVLTSELRERGELGDEQRVVARIRTVRAGEVAAAIGTVPLLFSLARDRLAGETPAEFEARMRERLLDDPALQQAAQQQQLASQAAVVALGVTGVGIASLDGEPEWEDVTFSLTGGEPSVDVLGGSLTEVHDAILAQGSLRLPRAGGAAGVEAFPAEPAGVAGEPSGGDLRDDADGVPEPAAG